MFGFGKARAQRRKEQAIQQQADIDKALRDLGEAEQALLDKAEKTPDPADRYIALVELRSVLRKQSDAVTEQIAAPVRAKDKKIDKWLSYGSSGVGVSAMTAIVVLSGPAAIPGGIALGLVAKFGAWLLGATVADGFSADRNNLKVFRRQTDKNIAKIGTLVAKIEEENLDALAASPHVDKIIANNPKIKERMSEAFLRAAQNKQKHGDQPAEQPSAPPPHTHNRKLNL